MGDWSKSISDTANKPGESSLTTMTKLRFLLSNKYGGLKQVDLHR